MEVHRLRLSLMMFGQYLILGAWMVTMATYLMASPVRGGLNFSPGDASWIYSTLAIAGIVAPLFIGLLADRLFAAQKLMCVFHLIGSVLLFAAASWCDARHPLLEETYRRLAADERVGGIPLLEAEQSPNRPDLRPAIRQLQQGLNAHPEMAALVRGTFGPLFALMLCYSFTVLLTMTLTTTIAMQKLSQPKRNFSSVRLWGTVGWIVTGLVVQLVLQPISPMPMYLAAALSAIMGLLCLKLPHTPPKGHGRTLAQAFGVPALGLFRDRSFQVFALCTVVIAVTQQFWTVYANRYLNELQVPLPTATQTLAQIAEVACMASFAVIIPRMRLKWIMLFGLAMLALRNGLFATEGVWLVVVLGLPLHGISYAYWSVTGSIYVDQKAHGDLRASAQGILTFLSMGLGTFAGNWLSGLVVQANTMGSDVAWERVWLVPTGMCLVVGLVFALRFREPPPPPDHP